MKKIILYLSLICVLVLQFNIDIFADDVFDLSNYVSVSDLPDNELDSLGRVITGSLITHDSQNSNNYFNYTTWDDSSSAGFIYVTRDIGNYGYNYNYHIYLNGDFYSSTPTVFKCYTKTFTDSEISSSGDVESLLDNVVDDPNYSWNYPTAHYAFYADDIITNIPMFTHGDINAINAYLQNGDYSGALNSNDIVKKPVVPQPFFTDSQGLDNASRTQPLTPAFSDSMKYLWSPGSNENYNYENMGYQCYLKVNLVYNANGNETSSSYQSATYSKRYSANNPFADFSKDILNAGLMSALGENSFLLFTQNGYIVSADFYVRNYDSTDISNCSAWVYFKYNFLNKNTATNNTNNDNNGSIEESTEVTTTSPNGNSFGDNNSGSSSSSSATANGVVVNVTQNNTNGKSSIWDVVINALNVILNVVGNKIGGILDNISNLFSGLANITDSTGLLSKLLESLSTLLVGTPSSGGTSGGVSGGIGGLAGAIETITGSINNLISGVLSPFTDAITSLMDSVSDLLSASSELGQYITSGFGLLGENGYIAMFGSFFQFVPTEIWSLIKLAVGSSCSVLLSGSIVKLLRRN